MSTTKDFIENFKAKKFANTTAVSEYIKKELEVKDYVPFIEKQSVAQIVLESCGYMTDGVVAIDSVKKYMIFTITILSTYTNLEFNGDETDLESYDALCSYSVGDGTLLDAIIKTFEKEYVRSNDILNMMTSDLMAKNNIENQIGRFLSKITEKIDGLGDGLIDKLGGFNMDLSQLDINKLSEVIAKIK